MKQAKKSRKQWRVLVDSDDRIVGVVGYYLDGVFYPAKKAAK